MLLVFRREVIKRVTLQSCRAFAFVRYLPEYNLSHSSSKSTLSVDFLAMNSMLSIVILLVTATQSMQTPFDTMVSFGDSNSDTGNVYNLTGWKWPPASLYYQGRFSNGPVWIEKLDTAKLTNYAYGSATSDNNLVRGYTAFNTTVPGVRQQIGIYRNSTNMSKIDFARTIYIVWAGGNDYFFDASLSPAMVVASLMKGVDDLIQMGGQQFLIVNQPPLQLLPAVLAFNNTPYFTALVLSHNSNLSRSIQSYQAKFSNVTLRMLDMHTLITNILMNNSTYGINAASPCLNTSNVNAPQICTNPDSYLFFDDYHFTTRMHQRIADSARLLLSPSSGTKLSSSLACLLLACTLCRD